jgi:hypothetical protein
VGNAINFVSAATNTFTFVNSVTTNAFGNLSEMTFFDADGDGKGDLAFVGTEGITGIFANTSSGPGSVGFSNTPYSMPVGDLPGGTTYGDLDGDGLLDWIVTVTNDWSMEIFRNQSTPGNIFFGEGNSYMTGRNPIEVKVMDFDGDGRPDIVVANKGDGTVSVYRNLSTGTGNFTFAQKVDFPACSNAQTLAIADFDGDGKPDIAVVGSSATAAGSNVVVLRNLSTPGNISFARPVKVDSLNTPWSVAVGDFNGDGKLDLAVTVYGTGQLNIYTNTSTVESISFGQITPITSLSSPQGLAVGDLNGDGWPDVVVANSGASTVSVFQNGGNASFTLSTNLVTGTGTGTPYGTTSPNSVVIADMDGDGRPDVTAGNYWATNSTAFLNTSQY